jgi:hypothetical protein
MPTCITSTPFPVPPAAGLPCRLPLPLRRPGPAAAPSARAHGIPASGRGALAVPVSWPGCCRWPAPPGSAPACLWWTAGHGAGGRAAAAQRLCWLVLDFKHTSPAGCGCVLATGGPRGFRPNAGRGAAGGLSAWPHRQCCGRVFAAGPGFGKMNRAYCRARSVRGGAAGSGRGRIRMIPRFSAAGGAVPRGGFAVVREGV